MKKDLIGKLEALTGDVTQPLVGYLCSYTPLEVIHAAGFQPIRLFGRDEPVTQADAYLHGNLCPYVRSVLDRALEGDFNALQGVVFANSCNAMQRLGEVWKYFVKTSFTHLLDIPKKLGEPETIYFSTELKTLCAALERQFNRKISEAAVEESIIIYSALRTSLQRLSRLRMKKPQALSAADFIRIMNASTQAPPELVTAHIEEINAYMEQDDTRDADAPRILLSGGIITFPEIISTIEQCGAVVVAENLCTGMKSMDIHPGDTGDAMLKLARGYLNKAPCARMVGTDSHESLLNRMRQAHVDGVIFYTLKFCDPNLFDIRQTQQFLVSQDIPSLILEGDYTSGNMGQMTTRIEAFVEMLE